MKKVFFVMAVASLAGTLVVGCGAGITCPQDLVEDGAGVYVAGGGGLINPPPRTHYDKSPLGCGDFQPPSKLTTELEAQADICVQRVMARCQYEEWLRQRGRSSEVAAAYKLQRQRCIVAILQSQVRCAEKKDEFYLAHPNSKLPPSYAFTELWCTAFQTGEKLASFRYFCKWGSDARYGEQFFCDPSRAYTLDPQTERQKEENKLACPPKAAR